MSRERGNTRFSTIRVLLAHVSWPSRETQTFRKKWINQIIFKSLSAFFSQTPVYYFSVSMRPSFRNNRFTFRVSHVNKATHSTTSVLKIGLIQWKGQMDVRKKHINYRGLPCGDLWDKLPKVNTKWFAFTIENKPENYGEWERNGFKQSVRQACVGFPRKITQSAISRKWNLLMSHIGGKTPLRNLRKQRVY